MICSRVVYQNTLMKVMYLPDSIISFQDCIKNLIARPSGPIQNLSDSYSAQKWNHNTMYKILSTLRGLNTA